MALFDSNPVAKLHMHNGDELTTVPNHCRLKTSFGYFQMHMAQMQQSCMHLKIPKGSI